MQNTKGTEYSLLKGIKKTPKTSLMKKTCKKQAESPRTQFRVEASFLQVRENSPQPARLLAPPAPHHSLKFIPARQREERQSHKQDPTDPQISLPLVRKPSQASEISPLLRKHMLSDRLGKCQSLSKIRHLLSHMRIMGTKETSFVKCCLSSTTAVKFSPEKEGVFVDKKLGGRDWTLRAGLSESKKTKEAIERLWRGILGCGEC